MLEKVPGAEGFHSAVSLSHFRWMSSVRWLISSSLGLIDLEKGSDGEWQGDPMIAPLFGHPVCSVEDATGTVYIGTDTGLWKVLSLPESAGFAATPIDVPGGPVYCMSGYGDCQVLANSRGVYIRHEAAWPLLPGSELLGKVTRLQVIPGTRDLLVRCGRDVFYRQYGATTMGTVGSGNGLLYPGLEYPNSRFCLEAGPSLGVVYECPPDIPQVTRVQSGTRTLLFPNALSSRLQAVILAEASASGLYVVAKAVDGGMLLIRHSESNTGDPEVYDIPACKTICTYALTPNRNGVMLGVEHDGGSELYWLAAP